MVSSNDLILFYLGLELQSLSLYILASIDRDNLRSTESGIKYFNSKRVIQFIIIWMFIVIWIYRSTNFEVIASQLNKENTGAIFAMVFILLGLPLKFLQFPFICGPQMFMKEPRHQLQVTCGSTKSSWVSFIKIYVYSIFKHSLEWQQF